MKSIAETEGQMPAALNPYRHFYLYAKHWYKRTDVVEDLRVILSNYCGIELQYITKADVYHMMLDIALSLASKNPYLQRNIIDNSSPDEGWKVGYATKSSPRFVTGPAGATLPDYDYQTAFIYACKSFLCLTDRGQFGNLGEPDYTILTKKDKE